MTNRNTEHDEFLQGIERELRYLSDEVERLHLELAKASQERQRDALRSRLASVRHRAREFREASTDARTDLRHGLESAWRDLRGALQTARGRFRGGAS